MKNVIILVLFIMGLLLNSCSEGNKYYHTSELKDGIEIIHNKNNPMRLELEIDFEKLFVIDFENHKKLNYVGELKVDSKSNIFVLDSKKNNIVKFNSNGLFEKVFVKQGTGPGEVQFTWNMAILNDTIIIDDPASKRLLRFDVDGNFIDNIKLKEFYPERFSSVNKEKIIGFESGQIFKDDKMYSLYNLTLFNKEFESEKNIVEIKNLVDDNFNFLDCQLIYYCVGNNNIYVATNSATDYKIKVFDSKGKLNQIISKSYSSIKYNKSEWDKILNRYKKNELFSNNKSKFKKAINRMRVDKYGNLWVFPSVLRNDTNISDLMVDIFNKKGFFLKRININSVIGVNKNTLFTYNNVYLVDDKIFIVDNANQKIEVYNYIY